MTFNKEARVAYLAFAESPDAIWSGNFRDLAASITRMATLSASGRIDRGAVDLEQMRLRSLWEGDSASTRAATGVLEEFLAPDALEAIDPFDRVQLEYVVSVCLSARSLSEAGRSLFAKSREQRKSTNDADRLRKYLARFGLSWAQLAN